MPAEAYDKAEDPLIGRTIADRFKVEALVGAGAMGRVYAAEHLSLHKRIALKVLKGDISEHPVLVARFKSEALAASRLEHPNTVQILDFGADGDTLFIAMEYLQGQSLAELLHRVGQLSALRACRIMSQILSALATAHQNGIVHRDLKPSNIMLLRDPTLDAVGEDFVKVCDFGIAKIQSAQGEEAPTAFMTLTQEGAVIGTPAFMAPEQARGDRVDARADIYACGAMLYRMLTGENPFRAENLMGLIAKVISEPPRPASRLNSSIAPGLEAIVHRALEKSPADRFGSAREMHQALQQLQQGGPAYAPRNISTVPTPHPAVEAPDPAMARSRPGIATAELPPTPPGSLSSHGGGSFSGVGQSSSLSGLTHYPTGAAPRRSRWWALALAAVIGVGAWLWLRPEAADPDRLAALVAAESYGAAENYALTHHAKFAQDPSTKPLILDMLRQRREQELGSLGVRFQVSFDLAASRWSGAIRYPNRSQTHSFNLDIQRIDGHAIEGRLEWPEQGLRAHIVGYWDGNQVLLWEDAILPGSDPDHSAVYKLKEKKILFLSDDALIGIDGPFRNRMHATRRPS